MRILTAVTRWRMSAKLGVGPVMWVVRNEASRQCVRLGHDRLSPAHLLLAVASINEQLSMRQMDLDTNLAPHCRTDRVLRSQRVLIEDLVSKAVDLVDPAMETSNVSPRTSRKGPSWTVNAVTTAEQANLVAARLNHRDVGTEHLLVAILDSDDPGISTLLQRLDVDHSRLRREAERLLVA
jgi:hypothetical protein